MDDFRASDPAVFTPVGDAVGPFSPADHGRLSGRVGSETARPPGTLLLPRPTNRAARPNGTRGEAVEGRPPGRGVRSPGYSPL